jgi:hypothetical protein
MNDDRHLPMTQQDNNPHASPSMLLDMFNDLEFPTERATIWTYAKSRKADTLVMNRIKHMPEQTYENMEQFRKAFAEDIDNYGVTH